MMEYEKVFEKWYKIVSWALDRIDDFPKKSKFTIGDTISKLLFLNMERLVEAHYKKDKMKELQEININLNSASKYLVFF